MAHNSFKKRSKEDWGCQNESLTMKQIKLGAILRIADATELMAKRHVELIYDRDYWEKRAKRAEAERDRACRVASALRGHLKRAKAKAQESSVE